jgi:uncharacterized repeat protein (TIGR03803 family)
VSGFPRWSATVLHDFVSNGQDGTLPSFGSLAIDTAGRLYGTTQRGGANDGGTAYMLTPPKPGKTAWAETILHTFGGAGDGELLEGGLTLGPSRVLYGATDGTNSSNQQGTVFSLTPPPAGQKTWTESVLYSFALGGPFGSYPRAGVVRDSKGDLLGLTNSGGANSLGTIFRLSPAGAGTYTPADLFDFTTAANKVFGTLTAGKAGYYYGVTYNSTGGYGTVFSFRP